MNETFKTIAVTTLLCAASGFTIAFFHASTAQLRQWQTQHRLQAAVEGVFPSEIRSIDTASGAQRAWIGKIDSVTVGYAFVDEAMGYSGPISAVVGIDTAGVITGVVILSESENPSRGARMEEPMSQRTVWSDFHSNTEKKRPWFTEQFKGITICKPILMSTGEEWPRLSQQEKKDLIDKNSISAISGATVSSRAVVRTIEKSAAPFNALRGTRQ